MTSPSKLNGDKKETPNNKEKNETGIVKKEEIDNEKEDEEEEEEEDIMKEQDVSLKLDRSLAWFQAPLPPEKNSYTPVHILSSTSTSTTTSSSASSGEHSSAVKDSLDRSIDCVRNEVLEVLTKTIYSVARSLRSDPVSQIRSYLQFIFLKLSYKTNHDKHFSYFFSRSLFLFSFCSLYHTHSPIMTPILIMPLTTANPPSF